MAFILVALAFALAFLMDALIRKSKTRTEIIIYRIVFSCTFVALILWLVWLAAGANSNSLIRAN
jgi:hypothetical protein